MIEPKHARFTLDGRSYLLLRRWDIVTAPEAIAAVADAILADAHERARWRTRLGLADDDTTLRARVCEVLAQEWVVVDESVDVGLAPWTPDAPHRPDPIEPPKPEPPRETTWIEITVVDETGATLPGTRWGLSLPDGREQTVVLDEASKVRVDDLAERGSCHLRTLADPSPDGPKLPGWRDRGEDPWLAPAPPSAVMLASGRSHRVVVVRGRTELQMLGERDEPIAKERVRVRVAGKVQNLETDARGLLEIHHPFDQTELEVEFPGLADDVWNVLRDEPLAS